MPGSQNSGEGTDGERDEANVKTGLVGADVSHLFEEQHRAYNIIERHLRATLAEEPVPELRMFIPGEGGIGKSMVIQTVKNSNPGERAAECSDGEKGGGGLVLWKVFRD